MTARLPLVLRRAGKFLLTNADVAAPLLVALVLVFLSVAGAATTDHLITGTLGVLTLLSFSALRDRLQRDELVRASRQLTTELARISDSSGRRQVHVARNQEANNDHLTALIRALPNITAARFLAFSGRDARLFIEQVLERSDCMVQVLIKHPDTVGPVQQRWILAELDRMQRYMLPRYSDRLQVRCYRQPYSLRGRKLEPHLVDVGWYTPRPDDPVEVVGHRNPLITAPLDTAEGAAIANMFDEVFDLLWRATDSTDASTVATV